MISVIGALALPVSIVILYLFLYFGAKYKLWASFVAEYTIEFVNTGEKLYNLLVNVPGKVLTENGWIVPEGQERKGIYAKSGKRMPINPLAEWLQKHGFYWVGILYLIGLRKIHRFPIIKERLLTAQEIGEEGKLSARIKRDKDPAIVDHLRSTFPRPFLFSKVELADRTTVNILVSGIFDVVIPARIGYIYRERFFELLQAAIGGAVIDYAREKDYSAFIKAQKGKGSEFFNILSSQLRKKGLSRNLIEDLGVLAKELWVDDYELAEGEDVQKAFRAQELAKQLGEAQVITAKKNAEAAEHDARAAAAPILAMGDAYEANPRQAKFVNRHIITANLKNLRTLAGSGVGILVGEGRDDEEPEDKSPETGKKTDTSQETSATGGESGATAKPTPNPGRKQPKPRPNPPKNT